MIKTNFVYDVKYITTYNKILYFQISDDEYSSKQALKDAYFH